MVFLPKSRDICLTSQDQKPHPILSRSADAQDQEHEHRACAAGLPGIYNVDLVSHIKLRGVPKPEELALPRTGVPPAGA